MAKKLVKIIAMGVLIIMSSGLFVGCGDNKYNAVVIESGFSFKSEFLSENMTLGAYYYNENYDAKADESEDEYLRDETSPSHRIFVVKNQDECNLIFSDFQQVDFEKEMLLVYCYTDIYSRPRIIKSIELEGTTLSVEFALKQAKPGVGDASMPQCRILIIKMNALDVETVMFTKK